jgi:hypothetical protein
MQPQQEVACEIGKLQHQRPTHKGRGRETCHPFCLLSCLRWSFLPPCHGHSF